MDPQDTPRKKSREIRRILNMARSYNKVVWGLSAFMLVVYHAFIISIAFAPSPAAAESATSGSGGNIGLATFAALILIAFILSWVYTRWSRNNIENDLFLPRFDR